MRALAPPHLLLAAYCGGLCLALAWRPSVALLALAALLATAGLVLGQRPQVLPGRAGVLAEHRLLVVAAALMLLFAVAGVALGGARLAAIGHSTLTAYAGHHVPMTAVLTDLPTEKDGEVTLAVRVTGIAGVAVREPAHLRLRLEDGQTVGYQPIGPLTEGALLRLSSVSVQPLPAAKPGAFDYGRYLRRRGEHVLLEADFSDLAVTGRRGGLQGLIDRLRLASRSHLLKGVHSPVAEVLQGMVLGDDEGVSQETTRRLPRQRPASHHGGVGRERGAALRHVVVRLRAARDPQAGAHADAAAAGGDLRAADRRVAVHRARRGRGHPRAAGDPCLPAQRRVAAVAGAGCVAAHD